MPDALAFDFVQGTLAKEFSAPMRRVHLSVSAMARSASLCAFEVGTFCNVSVCRQPEGAHAPGQMQLRSHVGSGCAPLLNRFVQSMHRFTHPSNTCMVRSNQLTQGQARRVQFPRCAVIVWCGVVRISVESPPCVVRAQYVMDLVASGWLQRVCAHNQLLLCRS